MNASKEELEEYLKQINKCAESLAIAQNQEVAGFLPAGMTMDMVKMFTDGNLDKRFQKLQNQLEFVVDGFDETEFEEQIVAYVKSVPLAAYDTGCSDGDRFLVWLGEHFPLTDEQKDIVVCQRTRHAIEFLAREQRLQHVRFQELLSMVEMMSPEWGTNEDLWIHLNPVHIQTEFQTNVLVDEETTLPAQVLFFPVGADIRTAILEPEGEQLVQLLKEGGACRLEELQFKQNELDRDELIETCQDLAEMGLAAFG